MGKIQPNIRFGRKNGSYNFKKTDNGVQKTAFKKNAAANVIFKKYDKDNNNILDAQELALMNQEMQEAAQKHNSKNMGKKEAANFLGTDYQGTNAQKDILDFLNTIGTSADTVQSAFTQDGTTIVKYNPENNEQLTEIYKNNGEKSILNSKTITNSNDNSTTTIMYDETGENPVSKTIKKGSITIEVDPKTDRPLRQITDKGSGIQEIIEYTYDDENGTVTETTKNQDGTVISTKVKGKDGSEIKPEEKIEEPKPEENNELHEYTVQNGERFKDLIIRSLKAQGIENPTQEQINEAIKEFKENNPNSVKTSKKGVEYLLVGDKVKLSGKLEDKNNSEEQIEQYKSQVTQKRQASRSNPEYEAKQALEREKLKSLGLKDTKGAGDTITGEYYNSERKINLKKVGNAINGRTICQDDKGKYYVLSHKNHILKEDYVQNTTLYANGKKVTGKIKNQKGELVDAQFAEVPTAQKDKHGRTLVVDKNGKAYYMSAKGIILKNEYIARSNRADNIRENTKTAQNETLNTLLSQVEKAQADFDKQMDKDGWAADVADGISNVWGIFQDDGNQAWRVREDLSKFRSDIAELQLAASKENGEEAFKAKFEEKFGIPFNQNAVAEYTLNPTPENYKKAFGTKQQIGERVAQYNQSQDTGAEVVKTGAEVGGAIALTAATIATGGAAGVVAGIATAAGSAMAADVIVETSDRMSSKQGLQEGEFTEILKQGATDGIIAGATMGLAKGGQAIYKTGKAMQAAAKGGEKVVQNTITKGEEAVIDLLSDVAVGAGAEYYETGEVTLKGTAMNAAMGSTGLIGEKIASKLKGKGAKADIPENSTPVKNPKEVNNYRNEIADAEVARNIDQKHLNANERKMIADELDAQATPTEAELQAYHEEHKFKPVSDEDMPAYKAHQEQVAKDYAEAHRIENNAKITHEKAPKVQADSPEITALENEIGALDGQIKRLNQQLFGAKRANQMGRKNGDTIKKLENQIEALNEKRTAKAQELETAKKPAEVEVDIDVDIENETSVQDNRVIIDGDGNGGIAKNVGNSDVLTPTPTSNVSQNFVPQRKIPKVGDTVGHNKVINVSKQNGITTIEYKENINSESAISVYEHVDANGNVIKKQEIYKNGLRNEITYGSNDQPHFYERTLPDRGKWLYEGEYHNEELQRKLADGKEISIPETHNVKAKLNDDGTMTISMSDYVANPMDSDAHVMIVNSKNGTAKSYKGQGTFKAEPNDVVYFYKDSGGHLASTVKVPETLTPEVRIITPKAVNSSMLKKGVSSTFDANTKLYLGSEGSQFELDLSKLNLKDGQTITVGREVNIAKGDIEVPDEFDTVSRQHLTITRQGNRYIVKDDSSNGTEFVKTRTQKPGAQQDNRVIIGGDGNGGYKVTKGNDDVEIIDVQPASTPVVTSEQKMQMAQIGNNINRARTLADLDKAQQWLDKMPECDQKQHLQRQLNEKKKKFEPQTYEIDLTNDRQNQAISWDNSNEINEINNAAIITEQENFYNTGNDFNSFDNGNDFNIGV